MSTSQNNLNYTDGHDVDEDVKNVPHFGSDFSLNSWAGIHRRDFSAHNTNPGENNLIASSNM